MKITSLYEKYAQKSRVFLYPLLGIKRGGIMPLQTYISWSDRVGPEDMKLLCTYKLGSGTDFRTFERIKLLGNHRFEDFSELKSGEGLYIFDFSGAPEDWKYFLSGKYSQLSDAHKRAVKEYYGVGNPTYPYVESYLHPSRYYEVYAELVGEPVSVLEKVGELCSPPDMRLENLTQEPVDLEFRDLIP